MKEKERITRHNIAAPEPAEFLFLGIVTPEPDYRLSVILNRQLGISLQHSSNDIIGGSGASSPHFSVFSTSPAHLSLISNKSDGYILIKKLRTIDFLLVIHGVPDRVKADNLVALIRKTQDVTAVFVFSSTAINDRYIRHLVE